MPATLSPINFRAPLLKALYRLSGGHAGSPVDMEQTYTPIMQEMGIASLDQYGFATGTTQPWVARWIGFAFKGMKSNDLTTAPKRGAWALTAKGLDMAKGLIAGTTATVPLAVESGSDSEPVEVSMTAPAVSEEPKAAPAPMQIAVAVPVETPVNGVVLPVGPGHPDAGYHSDPYIVALALAATPCYGNFSNRSATCDTCPVKGRCINAMAASLTTLAGTLREQDKRLEAAKRKAEEAKARAEAAGTVYNAPAPAVDMDSIIEEMVPSSGTKPFSLAGRKVEPIKVMAASKCLKCGGTIAMGEKACWIPPTEGGETGSLHLACAKEG